EVLGLQSVSVTASFFALGGHSLLATRLLHGIRAAFGREIALHEFFRRPTIERVAALLTGEPGEPAEADRLPPGTPGPRDRPRPRPARGSGCGGRRSGTHARPATT